MDQRSNLSPKKAITFIVIGFLLVVAVITVIYMFINRDQSDVSDDDNNLSISNLNDYTDDKATNKDRITYIESALYDIVNLNSETDIPSGSVEDIIVRENSFSQSFDDDSTVHTVEFIVDIKSLQQSYKASYQWSDENPATDAIDEWGTVVQCLPEDQLIYEPFNCRDMFTEMSGTGDPAIRSKLPYTSNFYAIRTYVADNLETTISVQIMINTYENDDISQERFDRYKNQALSWLRDNDINPNKYTLEFRNFSNKLVSVTARKE